MSKPFEAMKIESETLISELIGRTKQNNIQVERLATLSFTELNLKAGPEIWSALECIGHLNLYGDYYLAEIAKRIDKNTSLAEPIFKTGFWGEFFYKSMLPKEKLNKMKAFKSKNPNGSNLSMETLEQFSSQQNTLIELLTKSRNLSLNKTKTSISISNLIKLKLGDTFRFVIAHNERHIQQALMALGRE